jgi:hypothetical protein
MTTKPNTKPTAATTEAGAETTTGAPAVPVPGPGVPAAPTRALGWTMIALAVLTGLGFTILSSVFEFPDILRQDGDTVLPLFADNADVVRPTYWMLAMTGPLLIAISVTLGRLLATAAPGPSDLVAGFGSATGVLWALGYARWPITMPYLADLHRHGDQQRASELYELLNRYAGMTVGEHLGFITMGLFAIALAVALRRAGLGPPWLALAGIGVGLLIAVTAYEQYDNGAEILGLLNGVANTVWFLWLAAIGVVLVRRSPHGSENGGFTTGRTG